MSATTYIYPPEPYDRINWRHPSKYTSDHMPNSIDFDFGLPHAKRRARTLCRNWPFPCPMAANMCAPPSPQGWMSTVRAAFELLLCIRHELLHGGGKAARGQRPCCGRGLWMNSNRRNPKYSMLRNSLPDLGPSALQEQDPYNTCPHGAYEAMSAVLGGTQYAAHPTRWTRRLHCPQDFFVPHRPQYTVDLQEETGAQRHRPLAAATTLRRKS